MRRLLCVWLPGWPTLRLHSAAAPDVPLATVESVRGQRRLAAVCPRAEALGLHPGMALTQARAICPTLALADADPAAERAGLAALAAWAERYTPLAAADPPDGFVLDITGCAHLFARGDEDGETALASDLLTRLARRGLPARAAIAGSAAAAWALARQMGAEWGEALTILPPGQERRALAALPLGLLRLDPRDIAGLLRLGVRTAADLARLPRGEIAARFGPAPLARLDQALGTAAETLLWPRQPPPWQVQTAFAEPIGTPEDLARALRLLAVRLCCRLADEVQGAQRFTATFLRTDGLRPAIAAATALAVRNPAYIAKLLMAHLDSVDPGFGVDAMTLAADSVGPLAPPQAGLGDLAGHAEAGLAATLDDLQGRLGEGRLWRPAPFPSHLPERAVQHAAPLAPPQGWQATPALPRPLRLLRRPEPVEAMAPVPDDPPVLFRWRGALHRVRAATGPERIAAEWWRGTPEPPAGREAADLVRDYYRVEDTAGARYWLFRTGRNAGAAGTRWFLHGVFG